jgi:hypothetical protein
LVGRQRQSRPAFEEIRNRCWLAASFVDTWTTRGDAQNDMVFGDPGARIPAHGDGRASSS